MLVIIQLFCLTVVSISHVFHWMIVLLDLRPTVFIYVWCHATNRLESCLFWFVFPSFIPWWPRTPMKVSEVQPLLSLFPNTIFVFSRVWLNYSLPTPWSSKFLKVSVVTSAQCLPNLGEAEERPNVLAVCASQHFRAQGGDGLAGPAKSAPLGLVRTKCAGTSAARLQIFRQCCARKKGLCLAYHLEHNYYFVSNKWCLSAVCCIRVLFSLEKNSSTWLEM